MIKENGNISIDTENIFPIIKKWLYSDKDIFIREVIVMLVMPLVSFRDWQL